MNPSACSRSPANERWIRQSEKELSQFRRTLEKQPWVISKSLILKHLKKDLLSTLLLSLKIQKIKLITFVAVIG